MAEGFLKSFDSRLEVFSAGTKPSNEVHPKAVRAMKEFGIDLSGNYPKSIDKFVKQSFDFVITVCGNAKENCPVFIGNVIEQLHIGFDDPADATGSDSEVMAEFRRMRDEIRGGFKSFYENKVVEK